MKDNKQLIWELEEAKTLVVSLVCNEIKQEQLSNETWNREKRDVPRNEAAKASFLL